MRSELATLIAQRRKLKLSGARVVFTNGCFDLLHAGHVALLEQAKALGDVLIVGINSDQSVRALKGPERPLLPEAERRETLLALEAVDQVLIYDEATPLETIAALVPDVLVKGADWAEDKVVGREIVERAGGKLVRVPLVAGRSTTALLEQIRRS